MAHMVRRRLYVIEAKHYCREWSVRAHSLVNLILTNGFPALLNGLLVGAR